MRVKAKTWGVIGKTNFTIVLLFSKGGLCETTKITKSQLQTVLITASGPQALNALVHRERYTQGSRQNRCVSSQKALALRAKAVGTEATSADRIRARRLGYTEFRLCVPCERPALPARRLPSREVGIPHFSRSTVLARSRLRLFVKPKIANSELLTAENPTV